MRFSCTLLCLLFLSSCFSLWEHHAPPVYKKWAWKPQYAIDTSYRIVLYYDEPKPVEKPGKIYAKDQFIYQCEIGKGIHIIDNTNPSAAHRIGFLEVKGAEEIAVKGTYLYTNNYYDLVTIDMSNPLEAQVVSRSKNAFWASFQQNPHSWEMPNDTGWYQCPQYYIDSVVVGWVKDSVFANCYKN